jgi:hypothetical protein
VNNFFPLLVIVIIIVSIAISKMKNIRSKRFDLDFLEQDKQNKKEKV